MDTRGSIAIVALVTIVLFGTLAAACGTHRPNSIIRTRRRRIQSGRQTHYHATNLVFASNFEAGEKALCAVGQDWTAMTCST
jgi:hypothetical protein